MTEMIYRSIVTFFIVISNLFLHEVALSVFLGIQLLLQSFQLHLVASH